MFVLAVLAVAPLMIAIYAYVGYPAILWSVSRARNRSDMPSGEREPSTAKLPNVTITVPVYNAAASIRTTLEGLTALEYPRERLQLLVLSDASTDGTDDIVREFAARGVELLRAPERRGKTAAENAALTAARGEIIVNVDGTVIVPPGSLKRLVGVFADPTIGVASGRDVSIGPEHRENNGAESSYVGYEMWVRDLETIAGSIVGASGCFYGIRRCIHEQPLPPELSWDFASPLVAKKLGYRSVSVSDAICMVPRTPGIKAEVRRKVRTMARGIRTLFYCRAMMNPFRYGGFAMMLLSHKLLRWLPYLLAPMSLVALGLMATQRIIALILFVILTVVIACGLTGLRYPRLSHVRAVAGAAFIVGVFAAGFLAWWDVLRGVRMSTWDPTARPHAGAPRVMSAG